MTTEQQHQRLHEVHKHLRHAATADRPEEIRERLRLAELQFLRHQADETQSELKTVRPVASRN